MKSEQIRKLLQNLYNRKVKPEDVLEKLKILPYEDLGFAQVDHHRSLRTGMPEVIYCEGKTAAQISAIIKKIHKSGQDILATRLSKETYQKLKKDLPAKAVYHADGRVLTLEKKRKTKKIGSVLIVTAGTSDIPVAEEAAVTAEIFGSRVDKIFDVGVAGIHRLLDKVERLRKARVIIVVAGMDGALVSVVGGLVECPVIGVPTSIGYGTAFEGVAPLLTMLNSCASGVATSRVISTWPELSVASP